MTIVVNAVFQSANRLVARGMKGVVRVLTAKDVPGTNRFGIAFQDQEALVERHVRCAGDPVALVAAESDEIARDALKEIRVTYRPLPVITTVKEALAGGAPKIHEKGNLLKHIKVRKGDMEKGFAEADVILEHTFHTPATDHAFIEPECSIGVPLPDGRMEIYVGSQIPYQDRTQVARVMGWPEERVRVVGQ